jgi:hypothetical protein
MKIYNSDSKKYGGDQYDILNTKLQIFYDCCSKVKLNKARFHSAFSIILKDKAADFYFNKISGRLYGFRKMVEMTKAHFETEENRQKYLSEWRETILRGIITQQPDKSRLECLELLLISFV